MIFFIMDVIEKLMKRAREKSKKNKTRCKISIKVRQMDVKSSILMLCPICSFSRERLAQLTNCDHERSNGIFRLEFLTSYECSFVRGQMEENRS